MSSAHAIAIEENEGSIRDTERAYLFPDELQALLKATRAHPCGMMIRLVAGVGVRLGEVVQIQIADCNFEQRILTLRNPQGDPHRDLAYPDCIHYDLVRESQGRDNDEPLFAVRFDDKGRPKPVARRTFQNYLTVTARRLELGVVTVHTLRKTLAVEWLVRGVDERLIVNAMGFANRKPVRKLRLLAAQRGLQLPYPIG